MIFQIYKKSKELFLEIYNIIAHLLYFIGVDRSLIKFAVLFFGFRFLFFDYTMVPSGSMTPTSLTGDLVLVDKRAYGISSQNIHFPFFGSLMFSKSKFNITALLHKMFPKVAFFDTTPKRGDLCCFILSEDPKTIYFKRIVAIGGDTVQMKDKVLFINDVPVSMVKVKDTKFVSDKMSCIDIHGEVYLITLENGVSYHVFRDREISGHDNTPKYKVPLGHVWVQGDCNTNSQDSFSYDYTGGAIPIANLIGKPILSIAGTNARDEVDPSLVQYFISLPIRISRYIWNLDSSRVLKRLK